MEKMAILIYNTLTRKREEFVPVTPGKVSFYLCGPTVYDYFHIGNARPFIVFDVFRNFLIHQGFDVTFVVNITDVDNKIIQRANTEKRSAEEVAGEFTDAYQADLDSLRVQRADVQPKATEHIPEMLALIQGLVDKGIAYPLNGDVYYSVEKFRHYGLLSGKNIDELQAGARVEVDDRKGNPLDFALWKSAKPGEPYWESPWGKGRPGWHIECSAMSMKYLGGSFDIHAGGEDLIFPHHENEIAQSCGAGDNKFARYWLHNGFLRISGEKMSKSLGNVLTVRDILTRHRPEVLRLFFLQKHYRSPINYTEELLEDTEHAWLRLRNFYDELKQLDIRAESPDSGAEDMFLEFVRHIKEEFISAMKDDFNTALATGKIFELVKEGNRILTAGELTKGQRLALVNAKTLLEEMDSIFRLLPVRGDLEILVSEDVKVLDALVVEIQNELPGDKLEIQFGEDMNVMDRLIKLRNELRKNKIWGLADKIRDRLKEIGYVIEDRADKTIWKKDDKM
jgi:cysteinyl-tRNA synthetase